MHPLLLRKEGCFNLIRKHHPVIYIILFNLFFSNINGNKIDNRQALPKIQIQFCPKKRTQQTNLTGAKINEDYLIISTECKYLTQNILLSIELGQEIYLLDHK